MITAKQCRAAREFLEWKQKDLSKNSLIAVSTIADFERGHSNPNKRTLQDLIRTFENAGIKFLNDEEGEGVRLLK